MHGQLLLSHTEDGTEPDLINTGTWTPNLPSLQYYKIKLHIPGLGAEATNVVYNINPGGGVAPWKIRVNQAWNSEQWVTIGTFAMETAATSSSPTAATRSTEAVPATRTLTSPTTRSPLSLWVALRASPSAGRPASSMHPRDPTPPGSIAAASLAQQVTL
ncbi:hypothetical protein QRX50_19855 [Amycolatopsis carbonis]|uniref:Golvesin/Xly CBD-like domain-containing protein n=1 Tax=Amycolatopsis carbonis TaxID=715471 RepID=A0A9Y2IQK4_9PSEU|nr:hypothetical protein [Amycolatopsis sp. 2-15]WIX84269.1 hypothetical protein QRX50_19855 [Amycolatopsis sp. 2-15]